MAIANRYAQSSFYFSPNQSSSLFEEMQEENRWLNSPMDQFADPWSHWETPEMYCRCDGGTIDWDHLGKLLRDAATEAGYHGLYLNMVNIGLAPGFYPRYAPKERIEELVASVHCMCGWIRASAQLWPLKKVMKFSWVQIQEIMSLGSPGHVNRKLAAVRERADVIFSNFRHVEGREVVSWYAIVAALCVEKRVGKAAIIAVANHLSGDVFRTYKAAREWLVEFSKCSVLDTTDGVSCWRAQEPVHSQFGIQVYRTGVENKKYFEFQYLVMGPGSRSFHTSNWNYTPPEEAVEQALDAWKQQRRLERANADLVGFLKGDRGYCPLVYLQDSYSAGNCVPGTSSWMARKGWDGRKFIPGEWLIPHLGDERVRRVAMQVYRNLCGTALAA